MGSPSHPCCPAGARRLHSFRSTMQIAHPRNAPWEGSDAVLALSRSDLKRLVSMPEAIELMKLVFGELSAGRATSPVRTVIDVNHDPSAMLMMPAYVPAASSLGFK